MTYRQILEKLLKYDERNLDKTATVFLTGHNEYLPVESLKSTGETDVLDEGHPIFIVRY